MHKNTVTQLLKMNVCVCVYVCVCVLVYKTTTN